MIDHPVAFHRDFRHDFPSFEDGAKKAVAALPLLGLYRPFRGPLSVAMSAVRTVTHGVCVKGCLEKGELKEGAFHLFHAALATAAVGLFFFRPIYTFLFSSVSDLILNTRTLIESIKKGQRNAALEALAFMSLDALFLLSFSFGLIEITVACMVLQIAIDLYLSARHFKKGDYFEGVCQMILAGGHMHQAIPQMKLMLWTWRYKPTFTGTLRQDERGFVYLDLPDEDLKALEQLFHEQNMELPPYFGKGRAGAHVSVISVAEARILGGLDVAEVGKKYTFRIVSVDSVVPDGLIGVDRVHYLTLSCSELEALRAEYGLSEKMNGHDFHFTFGIEYVS